MYRVSGDGYETSLANQRLGNIREERWALSHRLSLPEPLVTSLVVTSQRHAARSARNGGTRVASGTAIPDRQTIATTHRVKGVPLREPGFEPGLGPGQGWEGPKGCGRTGGSTGRQGSCFLLCSFPGEACWRRWSWPCGGSPEIGFPGRAANRLWSRRRSCMLSGAGSAREGFSASMAPRNSFTPGGRRKSPRSVHAAPRRDSGRREKEGQAPPGETPEEVGARGHAWCPRHGPGPRNEA